MAQTGGASTVTPFDGTLVAWRIKQSLAAGTSGCFTGCNVAIQVLRNTGGGAFQSVYDGPTKFLAQDGLNQFPENTPVLAGDLIALKVLSGTEQSGVYRAGGPADTASRWTAAQLFQGGPPAPPDSTDTLTQLVLQADITPNGGATPAQLPTPTPGKTAVVSPGFGQVFLVNRDGSRTRITEATVIPNGSVIDAKGGGANISTATDLAGGLQTALFYEGIFRVNQNLFKVPLTDIDLVEKLSFKHRCGRRAKGARSSAQTSRRKPQRHVWGSGKGKFRTNGNKASAIVRGTTWLTRDTCAGTQVRVKEGVVGVRDKVRRRTVTVRAGGATSPGTVRPSSRAPLTALAAAAVVAAALAGTLYAVAPRGGLERATVDARFDVRGKQQPPPDIAVAQVDDVTFNELQKQWPFPRSVHAKLIDRLRAAGVKGIVYDVQFTEPTEPKEDEALLGAVSRASGVTLGTTAVGRGGSTRIFGGDDVVAGVGAKAGDATVPTDSDGVIRRLPDAPRGLPTLAEAASGRTGGGPIDFRGPPGTFTTFSFSRVLGGKVPASKLRGRTVIVGASDTSLQDLHKTATSGSQLMAGPEIQANALDTVRRGFPLKDAPLWLGFALIALMALVAPAASVRLRPLAALAIALLAGALYLIAAQLFFTEGTIIPVFHPLLALAVGAALAVVAGFAHAALERDRARRAIARFIPPQLVGEALRDAGEGNRIATRLDATVLFADMRDSTSFAQALGPEQVLAALDRFLAEMSDAVLDNSGTLVSFMGDGVMAVFGAPVEQPDHADRALAAACDMQLRMGGLNAWLAERGMPGDRRLGIGLHSGEVMSGTVGSARRLEYAAIGDTTNTAARIESLTKQTADAILLSDAVRERLVGDQPGLRDAGEHEIRGRTGVIRLWGL